MPMSVACAGVGTWESSLPWPIHFPAVTGCLMVAQSAALEVLSCCQSGSSSEAGQQSLLVMPLSQRPHRVVPRVGQDAHGIQSSWQASGHQVLD